MMEREWRAVLARYGQAAAVCEGREDPGVQVRAFLQPVLDRREDQRVPSPLGLRREDRFLYLGPPDVSLAEGGRVVWQSGSYAVQSAHKVGESHWWALLRPLEEAEE